MLVVSFHLQSNYDREDHSLEIKWQCCVDSNYLHEKCTLLMFISFVAAFCRVPSTVQCVEECSACVLVLVL